MATCQISYSASAGFTITDRVVVAKDDTSITFVLPSGWVFVTPSVGQYLNYQTPAAGDPVAFLALAGSRSPNEEFANWNQRQTSITVAHAGPGSQIYNLAIYVKAEKKPQWYPVNLAVGVRNTTDEGEIVVNND